MFRVDAKGLVLTALGLVAKHVAGSSISVHLQSNIGMVRQSSFSNNKVQLEASSGEECELTSVHIQPRTSHR